MSRDMVRTGRVDSVDEKKHTVRVELSEGDGTITPDLAVLVQRAGDYALPPVGSAVLCLMLPGTSGIGFVLGILYNDADVPPLSDKGQRSIASDDLRLGTPDAKDKIALAPKVKGNFDDLKKHFTVIETIITGAPIPEPGNGSPSAFQSALAAAIGAAGYPDPGDVAAENVSAK